MKLILLAVFLSASTTWAATGTSSIKIDPVREARKDLEKVEKEIAVLEREISLQKANTLAVAGARTSGQSMSTAMALRSVYELQKAELEGERADLKQILTGQN